MSCGPSYVGCTKERATRKKKTILKLSVVIDSKRLLNRNWTPDGIQIVNIELLHYISNSMF